MFIYKSLICPVGKLKNPGLTLSRGQKKRVFNSERIIHRFEGSFLSYLPIQYGSNLNIFHFEIFFYPFIRQYS